MMKELTCILRTGALGLSLAFLPFAAPTPLAQPAFAAHHLDWDAMDEDEFYERLGNISGEAVMAVMEDEDLDDLGRRGRDLGPRGGGGLRPLA